MNDFVPRYSRVIANMGRQLKVYYGRFPDGDAPGFGRRVEAYDAEHAAEMFAEEYDADDYPLSRGHTGRVEFYRASEPDKIFRFDMTAESHVIYSVVEIEDGEQ